MSNNLILENDFKQVEEFIYNKCNFKYSSPKKEEESDEYGAGTLELNNLFIKLRSSKATPKKIGQFVTLWKRDSAGITQPYDISNNIDFVVINARKDNRFGQFVFPFEALEKHGIVSGAKSKGKRGFRVYPAWDKPINTQAIKTQKWQLDFFLEIHKNSDLNLAKNLYSKEGAKP